MNSLLNYPGGKWSIAEWIINFFPEHHAYLEPFFGSGAVFFKKGRSNIETINDLDKNVVNFFEWVKKDPERLAKEIYYIPYAHEIYKKSCKQEARSSLEKAVNFCIRLNMSHGCRTNDDKIGWKRDIQGREKSYAALHWKNLPEKIISSAERLRGVQIECAPAVEDRNALQNWYMDTTKSYAFNKKERTECLWMNFDPIGKQMSIGEYLETLC